LPAAPAVPEAPPVESIAVTSEYIPGVMPAFGSVGDVLELSRP
jgi:hypothetical protein